MRAVLALAFTVAFVLIVGACSPAGLSGTAVPSTTLEGRLIAIGAAADRWRSSTDLESMREAAEETRNLIVGPDNPFYGDADGNGTIAGAATIGVLPGAGGEPGLATSADGPCVQRDVLGGNWSDPAMRWSILETAIEAWSPAGNTFPALPSHPQRVVGWATLALRATELETALGYAGHAQIHVDVSLRAVVHCAG